jgi:hypothetical protein
MSENRRQFDTIIGLVTLGGAITGVAGLVVAFVALLSGEFVATGVCLVAAALSFGLLANALIRE